jgi:hypothetical protein
MKKQKPIIGRPQLWANITLCNSLRMVYPNGYVEVLFLNYSLWDEWIPSAYRREGHGAQQQIMNLLLLDGHEFVGNL